MVDDGPNEYSTTRYVQPPGIFNHSFGGNSSLLHPWKQGSGFLPVVGLLFVHWFRPLIFEHKSDLHDGTGIHGTQAARY